MPDERSGSRPDCSRTRTAAVRTSATAGERAVSPAIEQPRRAGAGDRVEADHGQRIDAVGRLLREPSRAERAEGATVGGDEDERVGRTRLQRRARHGRERAGELDQRGGARGVVVRAAPLAVVVPVRGDHDRALRVAAGDRDDVLELDAAAPRDVCPKAVRLRIETVERQLLRDPLGGSEAAGRSRSSIRVVPGELASELLGGRARRRRPAASAPAAAGGGRR